MSIYENAVFRGLMFVWILIIAMQLYAGYVDQKFHQDSVSLRKFNAQSEAEIDAFLKTKVNPSEPSGTNKEK